MSKAMWVAAALGIALLTGLPLVPAQPGKPKGEKYALIVGVQDYAGTGLSNLKYCDNDAHDLAELLADPRLGFDKKNILVLTQRAHFEQKNKTLLPKAVNIRAWLKTLKHYQPEDMVIVCFGGHGVHLKQFKDKGLFFCPEECDLNKPETLVSLTDIYEQLEQCPAGVKILVMDACRNDPADGKGAEGRLESLTRPLVPEPKGGIAAFFSCRTGEKSYESDELKHGIFTYHLLEGLKGKAADVDGDVTIPTLENYLTKKVPLAVIKDQKNPNIEQTPERRGKIVGAVVLSKNNIAGDDFVSKTLPSLKFVRVAAKGKTFLMGSPKDEKGRFDDEVQHEVTFTKDFYLGTCTVTRGQFRKFVEDTGYKTEFENNAKGGYGWDAAKKDWVQDPKYTWLNPGFDQTDEHPVVMTRWKDAVKFAEWLSRKDGTEYRLPTEAEWEYSCRGGTTSRYHFGNNAEDLAKYTNVADADFRKITTGKEDWGANVSTDLIEAYERLGIKSSDFKALLDGGIKASDGYAFTAPVGRFKPNSFGLYDMHGNVLQWCADRYGEYPTGRVIDPTGPSEGDTHVVRGGSWSLEAMNCRAADRIRFSWARVDNCLGFRRACSLQHDK
jgi:sulfatase modifying factor 1